MNAEQARSVAVRFADEQMRRASSRATQTIMQRFGGALGFWLGCGYPKSGTVWLCQLLSSCLDLPYPRYYRLPLAMPCVVHGHWLPSDRFPPTIYIVRDGRDVMVSLYLHEVRLARSTHNPRSAHQRRLRFKQVLGAGADLADLRGNLPRFMEAEFKDPSWMYANWPAHVEAWLDVPADRASVVRYEDLLMSVEDTLAPAIESLTGQTADRTALRNAATRFEFARQARVVAAKGSGSFLRKGISGDWKNHFSDEACETFENAAGATMRRAGYDL